jgi:hypothetical protein
LAAEAQAFDRFVGLGETRHLGDEAGSPIVEPRCWAPIEATSSAAASTPMSWHVPLTAFATISGTLMPISFPNTDWW